MRRDPLRATLLCVLLLALGRPAAATEPKRSAALGAQLEALFRESYPLEASISFSAALFHWVDSLAGTSGGKTIPLYQEEYIRRFGDLSEQDASFLQKFRAARLRDSSRGDAQGGSRGSAAMLGVFLEIPEFDAALERLHALLGPEDLEDLASALEHFRPRYEKVWEEGRIPRRFLDRAREDPARKGLEDLLARVARFFGVDPSTGPRPRLVLMPVPAGGGTHAEAVGRTLLVEIRSGERLVDEVAPIVHENSHYLWHRMSDERLEKLIELARKHPAGNEAWGVLKEALPTAIGQGVAARTFQRASWSQSSPWYHTPDVDAYAKAIYPSVQDALDSGATFDEPLLRKMLGKFRGHSAFSSNSSIDGRMGRKGAVFPAILTQDRCRLSPLASRPYIPGGAKISLKENLCPAQGREARAGSAY